ncbi:MAG: 3-hydroxyacyl-CoA dehydrogenase family protein, partial [bacterium]
PKDLTLKMALFMKLDTLAPPDCVFASNTSGLPIAAMAGVTMRPENVIGWHWASPAVVMQMAEIVITKQTAQSTIDRTINMAVACGKRPVIVRENAQAWGFAGNRVMAALLREARQVVADGVASEDDLDQLLVDGWGWPVGPFKMLSGAADGWGDQRESSIKYTQRI